jgi:hypothetical protein
LDNIWSYVVNAVALKHQERLVLNQQVSLKI